MVLIYIFSNCFGLDYLVYVVNGLGKSETVKHEPAEVHATAQNDVLWFQN